jgi:hypothetical protein
VVHDVVIGNAYSVEPHGLEACCTGRRNPENRACLQDGRGFVDERAFQIRHEQIGLPSPRGEGPQDFILGAMEEQFHIAIHRAEVSAN